MTIEDDERIFLELTTIAKKVESLIECEERKKIERQKAKDKANEEMRTRMLLTTPSKGV